MRYLLVKTQKLKEVDFFKTKQTEELLGPGRSHKKKDKPKLASTATQGKHQKNNINNESNKNKTTTPWPVK